MHDFSADRPIKTLSEDLLDRGRFAAAIAQAISSWNGKDSLVVAIHGDWGLGKTSLKNLVLAVLASERSRRPLVVEFNPWEWAAQEKIAKVFFDQIAAALGHREQDVDNSTLATKLRLYGMYLESGAHLVIGIHSVLPAFFITATFFGLMGVLSPSTMLKSIAGTVLIALLAVAATFKWGGTFLQQLANIVAERGNLRERSLIQLKDDIAKALRNRPTPILVVIDDIDRLDANETRMVFQLVKANGDFPSLVYLLLFQRNIVEMRLTDVTQNGRDYLEKIVQVPFDIPQLDQTRVEKALFAGLDRILEEDPRVLARFNQTRWGNLFYGGLGKYFKSLRHVYRYLSTLSFHVALLKGVKSFEVNPIDLLALECLRVFEPGVYRRIAEARDLFTRDHSGRHVKDQAERDVKTILGLSGEGKRESVAEIVKQVFPPIESLLGGSSYDSGFYDGWLKDLRACHPEIFPRYFQFAIPASDVSQSDVDELIDSSGNRASFVAKLNSLNERGLLRAALGQLDTYKQDVPLANSAEFVPALLDYGDQVADEPLGLTGISTHLHIVRIVLWYLMQDRDIASRSARLLSAFEASSGLSVIAHLLFGEDRKRERKESSRSELLLDDMALARAKSAFVERIRQLAENRPHDLLGNMQLASILYRWRDWDSLERVRKWVCDVVNSPEELLLFLDKFTSPAVSQTMGDHVARVRYRIHAKDLDSFLDIERSRVLARAIDRTALKERQKIVVAALDEALARIDKGISDDSWSDLDD